VIIINLSYKKKQWRLPSKNKKKRGKNLSPRNRKACHSAPVIMICIIPMSFDDCHQNLELNVDYKLKPDAVFLYCTVLRKVLITRNYKELYTVHMLLSRIKYIILIRK
jgi:hypothetical protein